MTFISEFRDHVNLDIANKKVEPTPYSDFKDFRLKRGQRVDQTFVEKDRWRELLTSHQLVHLKGDVYRLGRRG